MRLILSQMKTVAQLMAENSPQKELNNNPQLVADSINLFSLRQRNKYALIYLKMRKKM